MRKTKTKKVPVAGLPAMGIVRDVNVSDLFPNKEIRKVYPVNDFEVDRMIDNLNENGLLYPLIVIERDDKMQVLDGDIRRQALMKMGVTSIPVIIKKIANEDVVPVAILVNQRKRKSWVMRGKEVHHLLKYASRHLSELMQNDGSISRSNDWVAKQLGFKAQTRVDQLVKIVAFDDTLLSRVDTGEMSFEDAYRKSIGQPVKPAKQKELNKDSFACNCPVADGCPILKKFLSGNKTQKGGRREAA